MRLFIRIIPVLVLAFTLQSLLSGSAFAQLRGQYAIAKLHQTSPKVDVGDDSAFHAIITKIKSTGIDTLPIGKRVAEIGKLFLGTPYVEKTLDGAPTMEEQVVCNLRGLDCVTFFENAWALAVAIKKYPHPTMQDYQAIIQSHRYRGGKLRGFSSRLHYTSEYFYDNAKRNNLKDVTVYLGHNLAVLEKKRINFMSTHPKAYPALIAHPTELKKIKAAEATYNNHGGYYFIPKGSIDKMELGIEDGDIVGITTSVDGLDCSHTGILLNVEGRIHFMHASSALHKVVISTAPFSEYLAGNAKQTGIMIYRPLEEKKK